MTCDEVYSAALKAVRSLGPDLKELSWFKRNWRDVEFKAGDENATALKKAA